MGRWIKRKRDHNRIQVKRRRTYALHIDTGKSLIKGDVNLEAVENRFLFSKKINSAFTLTIAADWAKYGSDGFAIEIIEEIKPENEESSKAFRDRLKKLEGLHKEKYPEELLY